MTRTLETPTRRAAAPSRYATFMSRHASLMPTFAAVAILIVLLIGAQSQFPRFLSPGNLSALLLDNAYLVVLAVGLTFVILTGGIDLSVGSVMAFTGILGASMLAQGVPAVVAMPIMLVAGALIGLLSATYFYAYAGLMIPAGVLLDRVGVRWTVAVGGLVMSGGAFAMAVAPGPPLLFAGRFLVGAGASVMFVGALKIAAAWFPGPYFATLSATTASVGVLGGRPCGVSDDTGTGSTARSSLPDRVSGSSSSTTKDVGTRASGRRRCKCSRSAPRSSDAPGAGTT